MTVSQLPLYIGRTIDMLAFRGGQQHGLVRLQQTLADTDIAGEICTGLQKLAQRFLLIFLTEQGSVKADPVCGTSFMLSLLQGRIRNEMDMRAVFGLALQQAIPQLLDEETDQDPPDERFAGAELGQIVIQPGYVHLTIVIRSQAGQATIILPIPLVI